jgi:rubredoxin
MHQPDPSVFVAALAHHGATVTLRAPSALYGCTNCGCIFCPETDQSVEGGQVVLPDRYLIPGGECDAGDLSRPAPPDCPCHHIPRELPAPPSARHSYIEFTLDSGDHEVGMLRWRFAYNGEHGDPAEALEAATHAWLDAEPGDGEVSLTETLDEIPAKFLAANGLQQVTEPHYEQIELHDRLLRRDG